jgi:hypothetical protein
MEINPLCEGVKLSQGIKYAAINGSLAPEDRFAVNGQSLS